MKQDIPYIIYIGKYVLIFVQYHEITQTNVNMDP